MLPKMNAAGYISNAVITINQPIACAPLKRSLRSGITARMSLCADPKNLLSWINATPPYRIRKYAAMSISVVINVISIIFYSLFFSTNAGLIFLILEVSTKLIIR